MTTNAGIGHGVLFKMENAESPPVMTTIGEQTNITPPSISVDPIDATHSESEEAYREFIPGLVDGGEPAIEINYYAGDPGVTLLLASIRQTRGCEIVFPGGAKWEFQAFMTGFEPGIPMEEKMTATVTFKVTGKPTFTTA